MSLQKIDIFGIFRIKNGRQSAIFRVIKSKIEPIRAIKILNHPTKGKVKRLDGNQVIIRKRKTDGRTDGRTDKAITIGRPAVGGALKIAKYYTNISRCFFKQIY